jgi:hypothetical protein
VQIDDRQSYYLTTLGGWRRHSARFANSHFVLLDAGNASAEATINANRATSRADAKIFVLIEADEGVHLSLEDEPAFEPLPHRSRKSRFHPPCNLHSSRTASLPAPQPSTQPKLSRGSIRCSAIAYFDTSRTGTD